MTSKPTIPSVTSLEAVAEHLGVPSTTVLSWVNDLGHSMNWIQGRYYLSTNTVKALVGLAEQARGPAVRAGAR